MADKFQSGLIQKIQILCNKYNSSSLVLNKSNSKTFTAHINQNMWKTSINHQLLLLKTNRQLVFYNTFKTDTEKAVFLDFIKNALHRTAINKFCLGNHRLRIETGRHSVPKTPENLRVCSLCQSNEIENESHVLFSCIVYNNFRSKFFDDVIQKYNSFKDLDVNSKILFLFNSIDPFICRSVAAFIFDIMKFRYKRLFPK